GFQGGGFPGGGGGFFGGGGGGLLGGLGGGGRGQQQPTTGGARTRPFYITADERTNSVLVSGPADKIAHAKKVLEAIDVGKEPVAIGQPSLRKYDVPNGTAEAFVTTFRDVYKASSTLKISAIGSSQLLIWATPEDHFNITKQ